MSDCRLEFTPHVNHITTAAVQSTYALSVLTSGESQGPLLWLNSRMRVRHGGGIWTLVVRRISNQYDYLPLLTYLLKYIVYINANE